MQKCQEVDLEKHITLYEIVDKKFNKDTNNQYFIKQLRNSMTSLQPDIKITRINLDKRYFDIQYKKSVNEVYLRDEVECFFSNHVHKLSLIHELSQSLNKDSIYNYYKKLKPVEVTLGGKLDVFISVKDAYRLQQLVEVSYIHKTKGSTEALKKYKSYFDYMTYDEVRELLNINYSNMQKFIKNKLITIKDQFNGTKLFDKEKIQSFHKKRKEIINKYKSEYYVIKQIREKYSNGFAQYVKGGEDKTRRKITKVDPPLVVLSYLGQYMKLYKKSDVDSIWRDYKLYWDLNSSLNDDRFEDFTYKVEQILKVKFNNKQINTKILWYQYVEKFLNNTEMGDESRILFQIHQFVRCTEVIFKVFKREIYSYSANEINKLFLNENVGINRSYQRDFYQFLLKVYESFHINEMPVPFIIGELNDPRKFSRIKEMNDDIYSLDEYHQIYNYVNDIDYHKEKAIGDVNQLIRTKNYQKYKRYDSCWLYIIVQLTNNWRHSTVLTQIPRIDLSDTSISSLEWLMENNPTLDDANYIIYQISRYVTKISKTSINAEGIFAIGEPLKTSFATAISICEFRRRATLDNSPTLIDLSGHLVQNYNPHKVFFNNINIENFKFENRKMNRTVATLIWSVLRHMGRGLEEAKTSRSHLKEETTVNHYIKLTSEQVNKIVNELFERNQFGFVTQALTNILFGPEPDKNIETQRMIEVNESFGDLFKIEATSGVLNRLSTEREEVMTYLKDFNLEELRDLYNKSMVGVLPTKQRYYQCIYSECIYENEFGERPQCDYCEASIINIYALEKIMDNYLFMMEKILTEFDAAIIGEKQRLANQFFLLHNVVARARKKFGRDVVDSFIEGGTKRIKEIGTKISVKNLKGYRTSGLLERVE